MQLPQYKSFSGCIGSEHLLLNQSTATGCMFSASFLSSWNRTDDRYRSPKLGWTVYDTSLSQKSATRRKKMLISAYDAIKIVMGSFKEF